MIEIVHKNADTGGEHGMAEAALSSILADLQFEDISDMALADLPTAEPFVDSVGAIISE